MRNDTPMGQSSQMLIFLWFQMLLDPMGGIVMTNDGNAILREVSFSSRIFLLNMKSVFAKFGMTMELCDLSLSWEPASANSCSKKGSHWGKMKYSCWTEMEVWSYSGKFSWSVYKTDGNSLVIGVIVNCIEIFWVDGVHNATWWDLEIIIILC